MRRCCHCLSFCLWLWHLESASPPQPQLAHCLPTFFYSFTLRQLSILDNACRPLFFPDLNRLDSTQGTPVPVPRVRLATASGAAPASPSLPLTPIPTRTVKTAAASLTWPRLLQLNIISFPHNEPGTYSVFIAHQSSPTDARLATTSSHHIATMFETQHYMDANPDTPKKRGRDDEQDFQAGASSFSEHRNVRIIN